MYNAPEEKKGQSFLTKELTGCMTKGVFRPFWSEYTLSHAILAFGNDKEECCKGSHVGDIPIMKHGGGSIMLYGSLS